MARKARVDVFVPEHPHHVVLRGNNRRVLFKERDRSRERFCDWLYDAAERFDVLLHALVLMSNHVHLLATAAELLAHSKFVQSFAQRFAQWHNRSSGGSGCLFEERHYAKPLRDHAHCAAVLPYIDLNPLRAGLVDDPRDYRWSTCAIYVGSGATALDASRFTTLPWYDALAADPRERERSYGAWLEVRRDAPAPDPRLPRLEAWSSAHTRPREPWIRRPDGTRVCEASAVYRALGEEGPEGE